MEKYEEIMKEYEEIYIYRLLFREQELRETRCLYEEIYSGGGARNYFKFHSSNIEFKNGEI